jgi:hypothetical protein
MRVIVRGCGRDSRSGFERRDPGPPRDIAGLTGVEYAGVESRQ